MNIWRSRPASLCPELRTVSNMPPHTLALLPNSGAALIEDLLAPCQNAANRQTARGVCRDMSSRSGAALKGCRHPRATSALSSICRPPTNWPVRSNASGSGDWKRHSVTRLEPCWTRLRGHCKTSWRKRNPRSASCSTLWDATLPSLCRVPAFCWKPVRIVETAPFEQLHLRQPSFESERTRPMLQAARQQAAVLKRCRGVARHGIRSVLSAGTHTRRSQLLECAAVLDEASLWKRFFGRDYRGAVKSLSPYRACREESPARTDESGAQDGR